MAERNGDRRSASAPSCQTRFHESASPILYMYVVFCPLIRWKFHTSHVPVPRLSSRTPKLSLHHMPMHSFMDTSLLAYLSPSQAQPISTQPILAPVPPHHAKLIIPLLSSRRSATDIPLLRSRPRRHIPPTFRATIAAPSTCVPGRA